MYTQYSIKKKVYWSLESRYHKDDYEKTIEKKRYLLEDAVVRQMVSDKEVDYHDFMKISHK